MASMAYSTWNRRPSGEKVLTPRSYSLLQASRSSQIQSSIFVEKCQHLRGQLNGSDLCLCESGTLHDTASPRGSCESSSPWLPQPSASKKTTEDCYAERSRLWGVHCASASLYTSTATQFGQSDLLQQRAWHAPQPSSEHSYRGRTAVSASSSGVICERHACMHAVLASPGQEHGCGCFTRSGGSGGGRGREQREQAALATRGC